jgi:hypothetical protein
VLLQHNAVALDVWQWCEGWNPDRVPFAAAYFGVHDLDLLMWQLQLVRDRIVAHREVNKARP